MGSGLAFREHRRVCRLKGNYLHFRFLLLQIFSRSGQSSACSDACDKDIDRTISISPDLRSRRRSVSCSICRVDELTRYESAFYLLGELLRLFDSSFHSLCAFSQYYLCAVSFQDVPSLNAHGLRHGQYSSVSLCRCYRRKSDSRVAGCRLNYY